MAIIKVLTNQGALIYEANTVIFNLDTHGDVEDFKDNIYRMVRQAEETETPLHTQGEKE